MRTAYILLLCVLGAAMLSTVTCENSRGLDSCCFSYHLRRIKKDLVSSYFVTDNRCTKPGVVLVTKQSRRICADPSLSWVEGIMKDIDEKSF
ncbi:C-C motif chemokine 36.1 isoform X1 [Acanthochromis polyacanthus]|uniref:C-C motif chemokine 36.1 isoform X1 n=1 Tax=Acanthochromis polyacanthus TaxID=80966 RepID=UPI002233EA37|nr:C-C motif chemokine 36.1 isoform X1 [Acanthochromis polyacanthus]